MANTKNRASHQVLVDYKSISSIENPKAQGNRVRPTNARLGNGRIRGTLVIAMIVIAGVLFFKQVLSSPPTESVATATNIAPIKNKTVQLAAATTETEAVTTETIEDPQPLFFFNSTEPTPLAEASGEVPFLEVDVIDDFLPDHRTPSQTPLTNLVPITAASPDLANDYRQEPSQLLIEVKPGDTLSGLLSAQNLSPSEIAVITNLPDVKAHLVNIRPGQEVQVDLDGSRRLTQITRDIDLTRTLLVTREPDNKFTAKVNSRPLEKSIQLAELTMNSSLFNDGEKAGLSESVIMELYSIFQWTVDFNREVRSGDRLTVLHETFYKDGKKVKDGNILAAEYHSARNLYSAFRHVNNGQPGYYDSKGRSLKKQFLRNPVKARITSRFNLKRKHPIRHTIRAHKGVDYGAPTGTPITAAGDGRVVYASKRGSYGNTVEIQHGAHHTTLYAHMNSFAKKIKTGTRVSQGQIIGYVGSTGLATGPHLHYEFRVDGIHRDPQKVELGGAVPLKPGDLVAFKEHIEPLRARLASLRENNDTLAMR